MLTGIATEQADAAPIGDQEEQHRREGRRQAGGELGLAQDRNEPACSQWNSTGLSMCGSPFRSGTTGPARPSSRG